MEAKGVTIHKLVADTGLAQRTIMRARGPLIEACTLKTLEVIAHALGVQVKDLFVEE